MIKSPTTTVVNCPRLSLVSSLVLKLDTLLLSATWGAPGSGSFLIAAISRFMELSVASLYFSSAAKTAESCPGSFERSQASSFMDSLHDSRLCA